MISPATTRVTLPYGAYGEAGYTQANPHAGVDFSWQNDTNIYAPEDATVTRVGYLGTAGESIDLVAGNNKHRMCHLSRYLVPAGQTVRQGQVIGIMGETGQAYGVHLHWVLWVNGVRVNGMDYVTKGDEMVTFEQLQQLSQAVLGRKEPVTKEWYDSNPAEKSMTLDQVLDAWIPSEEAKNFRFKGWDYDRLASEKGDDEFEVATVYVKKK